MAFTRAAREASPPAAFFVHQRCFPNGLIWSHLVSFRSWVWRAVRTGPLLSRLVQTGEGIKGLDHRRRSGGGGMAPVSWESGGSICR